jgi:Mn2+/Fe2+ NRAMP family transporter
MRWDALCSMAIYTFATVAFYLLGASVLHRAGLNPSGSEMVRTLGAMYQPVFGAWAQGLFLFGAFAVLYSTFFVASAGHARIVADALHVFGVVDERPSSRPRLIRWMCVVFPLVSLGVYVLFPEPAMLVIFGGTAQALMLPLLAGAALYFRYRRCDDRVRPGKLWDAFLWLSAIGLFCSGTAMAVMKLFG